ncbi:MAG TPA: IS630 transposase-related protein [Ktedonobacteraceae bacterium]|nr:IS630 transposase-related protein [Ktedonobacteraceae bacterium]
MRAYSQDLRERVLRAIDYGKTRKEVADLFGVSLSTIKRYLKQRSQLGHVQSKKIPGRPPTKRAKLQESLLAQLEAYPDATFQEHCDIWEKESGIRVSIMTMSRAIDSSGWTRKKNVRSEREKRRRANVMERKREKA